MSELTQDSHIMPFRTSSGKLVVPRRYVGRFAPYPTKGDRVASGDTEAPRTSFMTSCTSPATSTRDAKLNTPQTPRVITIRLKNRVYDASPESEIGWGIGGIADPEVLRVGDLDGQALPPPSPLCTALLAPLSPLNSPSPQANNFVFTPEPEVTSSPSGYDSN